MTVLDLIKSSLRLIGQLAPGRGPNASETADALLALNAMLERWGNEKLLVYQIGRDEHTLTPGTAAYTIGAGGDIDAARPVRLEGAARIPAGETDEEELEILTLDRRRGGHAGLYNDGAFPLATLTIAPAPGGADTLVLYPWRAIVGFAATDESVAFPPGYADAIRYNLAVRLAPEWNRAIRPDVAALAVESKAAIKSVHLEPLDMAVDEALLLAAQRYWG
jgi:hypothetical protein